MKIRELQKSEKRYIDEIVQIHLESFQGFFLTFMGKGFLKTLYKSYLQHKESGILVAHEKENIQGFIAYSTNYSGLFNFMIRTRLIPFAWYSLGAFLRKPKTFMRILGAFSKSDEVKEKDKYVELASIAVRKDKSGNGIGSKLISSLKEKFKSSEYSYIKLETDAENNEFANRFYQKNGFTLFKTYFTNENRKMNEYRYYL